MLLCLLSASAVAMACGGRSGLGVGSASTGAGGEAAPSASSATASSTAASSVASSGATTASSSASSSSGVVGTTCTNDGDCPAGDFCWLGACVQLDAVVAGANDSCAVTTAGGAQCWGSNVSGQLGNGSSAMESPVPVPVQGLGSGVLAMAAGWQHACALTTKGGVLCWGSNSAGQLGDGSKADSPAPVAVSGLSSGVVAISAYEAETCALTAAGGVQCWGGNYNGQLGNDSMADSSVPVPVSGLSSGIEAIAVGGSHACALAAGGGVLCWGNDDTGQLGDGSMMESSVPVPVSGLSSGVAAIAAGYGHTCAATTSGAVLCWGDNTDGQLGDGSTMESEAPVTVTGLSAGATRVAAGDYHTCALTTAGVQCWGAGATTPQAVPGLSTGVVALTAQAVHSCVLTTAGRARCWGQNTFGELGDGSLKASPVPVDVVEP